jgi:hypothetical protein
MVGRKGPYRVLVELEGKRSLGTPRYKWEEDNIKMDLKEIGLEGMN